MGSGISGLYSNTYGAKAIPGNIILSGDDNNFAQYISNRKDIDINDYFDVIAHGNEQLIQITANNRNTKINHRVLARLLKNTDGYNKNIRLLACNTGKLNDGFAQNLANKLNVNVIAPSSYIWALPNGKYFIADKLGGSLMPNMNKRKKFKTFKPKKRSK